MADHVEIPVGLTDRGRAVFAGGNALAVNGDDTLNQPTSGSGAAGTESTGEVATDSPGGPVDPDAPASDPAPGESTPDKETADDQSAAARETREN